MNLNIVTASSNSVGKAILQKIATPQDITLGLSRKGCNFADVINVQISDFMDYEKVKESLLLALKGVNPVDVNLIKIFHNCCYAVCEIPDLAEKYPEHLSNPKLILQDLDGDGIDDRSYHSLLSTFRNVFSMIFTQYPHNLISIGTICSLTDKKSYEPTVFKSMVRSNKILRHEIESLALHNKNIQSICISASTVQTETEKNFRKHCTEQEYRVNSETIADILVLEMKEHRNVYKDIDLYIPHPHYNENYKNETDIQMTERLKKEIGLI